MRAALGVLLISSVAYARPAREDIPVGKNPMNLIAIGDTVAWTDSAGEIWVRKRGKNRRITEQHANGIAMMLVRVGNVVLAPVGRDVEYVDLDAGTVKPMKLQLPEDPIELVGDDRAAYAVLYQRPEIMRIPIDGSAPTKILSVPHGVIAMHGTTVYVASYITGELVAWSTTTRTSKRLAKGLPKPTALVADGDAIYVSCEADRTLRRIDAVTGVQTTIGKGMSNADVVVSDAAWIYTYSWEGQGHGKLLRIAKDGSGSEVLASDLSAPYGIAVTDRDVWVTNRDAGSLVRFAK